MGDDIKIIFTGLSQSEKLSEKLYADEEIISGTRHKNVMKIYEQNAGKIDQFDRDVRELVPLAESGEKEKAKTKFTQLTQL